MDAGVGHIVGMRKADRRIEIDAMSLIGPFALHAEAVAPTEGRRAEKHSDFRLRRGGVDGRPAGRAEIELIVKILLLEKRQQQRAPGKAARPVAILVAV